MPVPYRKFQGHGGTFLEHTCCGLLSAPLKDAGGLAPGACARDLSWKQGLCRRR